MRQDLTEIVIVLDRSGSMSSVATDTIGGFNRFLSDQKAAPGDARLTLAQFDHEYEIVHAGKPIAEVPPLDNTTFVPRGQTALLDAIGRTIDATGARLSATPESDRPGKVLIVIVTDGHENASKEFTRQRVHEQITHQREAYNWQFIFLGANQDAIATGATIGIAADAALSYAANAVGTRSSYESLGSNVKNWRSGRSANANWTAADRQTQRAAGATH